jgi:hypothetical protein
VRIEVSGSGAQCRVQFLTIATLPDRR